MLGLVLTAGDTSWNCKITLALLPADTNCACGFPSWSCPLLATQRKERGEENNPDLSLGKDPKGQEWQH